MSAMEDKIRELEIVLELAGADIADRRKCCSSPDEEHEIEELTALLNRMRPLVLAAPGLLETCKRLLDILDEGGELSGLPHSQEEIAHATVLRLAGETAVCTAESEPSVASRVAKVEAIFREHYANADREADVTDLLADLRHYCSAHGLEFKELDRRGYGHYSAERHEGKNENTYWRMKKDGGNNEPLLRNECENRTVR
jgi:hypothetical protein